MIHRGTSRVGLKVVKVMKVMKVIKVIKVIKIAKVANTVGAGCRSEFWVVGRAW
jgi:hypothetical protein